MRIPGNVEEETVWTQLLEAEVTVVAEDDALFLVEEIRCGDGFSPDEFRRGF